MGVLVVLRGMVIRNHVLFCGGILVIKGLIEISKKSKILESDSYATAFMRLGAFSGD